MQGTELRRRSAAAGLLAIMMVGLLLRTVAIGREALWADEALTYVIAKVPTWALAVRPIDPTGPLYYWLHAIFIADGASPAVGRSISLVAGMLTVPLTYFAGRRIDGRRTGLAAAALVAVSGPLVDYSQEARAYAVLVMLVAASAVALLKIVQAVRAPRLTDLMVFAVLCLLALYTHFVAIFWVGAALAVLRRAADRPHAMLGVRHVYGTALAIAVGAIPELVREYRYASGPNAFKWLKQADAVEAATIIAKEWLPFAEGGALGGTLVAVAIAVMLMVGARRLPAWIRSHGNEAGVIAALLIQPLLSWLFGFISSPVFMPRTILLSVPGFALFAAVTIRSFDGWKFAAAATSIIAAATGSTLLAGTVRHKEEWAAATAFVRAQRPSIQIFCPQWKAPAMMAALGKSNALSITGEGGAMVLLRPRSPEETWDRTYFERYYRPQIGMRHEGPSARTWVGTIEIGEVALISSECSDGERRAIAAWLGAVERGARWRSSDRDRLRAIDVDMMRATGEHRARVSLPY